MFTIPAIKYLIERYERNVYLICFKETVPIYEYYFSDISIVIIDSRNLKINGRWADRKMRNLVKTIKPEIIFDLNGNMLSLSFMLFSKAKEIYGISRRQFSGFYTKSVEVRKTPHILHIYSDAIKTKFGTDMEESRMIFPSRFNNDGPVIIHPFAGWTAKEWGLNKFIQIADKLHL